ncbi:hypothetical protein MASR2M78_01200 [Treponema sp.]
MIKNRQSILSFFLSLFCFLGVAGNPFLLAQTISRDSSPDRNAVMAREEFRRGVQAFNRYGYNEAILSFEKALSYKPGEKLILDWLGRSYYQTGLEDTALRQWQSALSGYEAASSEGLLLSNRIETVRNRRSLFPELDDTARYVEAGTISNKNGDISIYKQPTSVLPNSDGTTWVVAYGSNELIRLDQNGLVIQRVRGPINGFDRPYDLARGKNGTLYVSEYRGARVSVLDAKGNWKAYIGERGRGNGQFVGPQNLSCDEDGYLYVVDFGNRRVSKFDPEGKFLLSFGSSPLNSDSGSFRGFRSPTGIAVQAGEVYVADSALQRIVRFDSSGNYQAVFLSEGLSYPESLRFDGAGRLLIADTSGSCWPIPTQDPYRSLAGLGMPMSG